MSAEPATVWCADCGDAYDAPLGCCPNCESVERLTERTKIIVVLEVAGSPDDAMTAVDQALDEGVLQDFLNDHDIEDVGPVRVLSAVAMFAPENP